MSQQNPAWSHKPLIKFLKLHPDAKLPSRAHETDTGSDIYAIETKVIHAHESEEVETGLQVAYIEPGYWFRIEPRSGLGFKYGLQPHLGVIDQGYRGHLSVKLYNFSKLSYKIKEGERIAQISVYPLIQPTMEWTEEVENTERGEKRLGSTGK